MADLASKIVSPAVLIYVLVVVGQLANGIYLAARFDPQDAIALLYTVGLIWAIGWWMRGDSRRRGLAWVYDMGLFLYAAWPIIMPYYLIKTRGARGLLVILGFCAAFGGAWVVGIVIGVVITTASR